MSNNWSLTTVSKTWEALVKGAQKQLSSPKFRSFSKPQKEQVRLNLERFKAERMATEKAIRVLSLIEKEVSSVEGDVLVSVLITQEMKELIHASLHG